MELDHVPALQFVQTMSETAPSAVDHVPTLQLLHDTAPILLDQVLTLQFKHKNAPVFDQVPALQFAQVVANVAPEVDDHLPA